jgi:glycine cleavage system H lipoate-binding protein/ABC-type phosphate transport system substrate-binding protein
MKKLMIVAAGLILLSVCMKSNAGNVTNETSTTGGNSNTPEGITLLCNPELNGLANQWATGFTMIHPDVKISVQNALSISKENLNQAGHVIMLTNNLGSIDNDSWKMVVGRDAIVPVFNKSNPLLTRIETKGVSADDFHTMMVKESAYDWRTLLEAGNELPLHFYMVNDPTVQSNVAAFMNMDQLSGKVVVLNSAKEFVDAIQKDPSAMGFCMLTDILANDGKSMVSNIALLPIDKNGNGKIDSFEKIFGTLDEFNRGVWIGKYPASLSRNIYTVVSSKPENASEIAFLAWVLNDGQLFLGNNGYFDLVSGERQAKMELLTGNPIHLATTEESKSASGVIFVLIGMAAVIGLGVWGFRRHRRNKVSEYGNLAGFESSFSENSVVVPKGLFFDKSHTWTFMEKNGFVRLGMDDFMQHVTGPITKVRLKAEGEKIYKGDPLFTIIQNGKQLTIYSPISGTIAAFNEELNVHASVLNTSPYEEGWIYLIEPTNWVRELQFMIRGDKFSSWLSSEFIRLKDFLATSAGMNQPQPSYVLLQDGGAIKDHILEEMGPEVWEDFQTKFIDNSR